MINKTKWMFICEAVRSIFDKQFETGPACDGKNYDTLGWEMRVWDDGRWNVVPPALWRASSLVAAAILSEETMRSRGALIDAFVADMESHHTP